jgi:hypothetical protein
MSAAAVAEGRIGRAVGVERDMRNLSSVLVPFRWSRKESSVGLLREAVSVSYVQRDRAAGANEASTDLPSLLARELYAGVGLRDSDQALAGERRKSPPNRRAKTTNPLSLKVLSTELSGLRRQLMILLAVVVGELVGDIKVKRAIRQDR